MAAPSECPAKINTVMGVHSEVRIIEDHDGKANFHAPVVKTRVNPVDDNADLTVERTTSEVRFWVCWNPSCTFTPASKERCN